MKVKLLGSLSSKGRTKFSLRASKGTTLRALLEGIKEGELFPGNPNLIVFINGIEFHMLGGYDATVNDSDEITILPAAHGGSGFSVWMLEGNADATAHRGATLVRCRRACLNDMGHVYFVAMQTWYALAHGELLANKPEVDFLLRLSRQKRISLAVERCGATGGGNDDVVTVCFGDEGAMRSMAPAERATIVPEAGAGDAQLTMAEESALTAI